MYLTGNRTLWQRHSTTGLSLRLALLLRRCRRLTGLWWLRYLHRQPLRLLLASEQLRQRVAGGGHRGLLLTLLSLLSLKCLQAYRPVAW